MADETYRGLLENISETSGTYKQMLQAIAEGGGSGGILICTYTDGVLDKTWQEIYDAISESMLCIIQMPYSTGDQYGVHMYMINTVEHSEGAYGVVTESPYTLYLATSADDYPAFTD